MFNVGDKVWAVPFFSDKVHNVNILDIDTNTSNYLSVERKGTL